MDETAKQLETQAINELIANYTQTWEYEGITVVLEKPPELRYLNGYPILECEPYFYINGTLISLGEDVYPFQWMGVGKYLSPGLGNGFELMINNLIDNQNIWQR